MTPWKLKMKDNMAFVIDNWFLRDFSLANIKDFKYIITAFSLKPDEENNE